VRFYFVDSVDVDGSADMSTVEFVGKPAVYDDNAAADPVPVLTVQYVAQRVPSDTFELVLLHLERRENRSLLFHAKA